MLATKDPVFSTSSDHGFSLKVRNIIKFDYILPYLNAPQFPCAWPQNRTCNVSYVELPKNGRYMNLKFWLPNIDVSKYSCASKSTVRIGQNEIGCSGFNYPDLARLPALIAALENCPCVLRPWN